MRFAKFLTDGQGATPADEMADASLQLSQLASFSATVDFVPSTDGTREGKVDAERVLRPGTASLSRIYKRILDSSVAVMRRNRRASRSMPVGKRSRT